MLIESKHSVGSLTEETIYDNILRDLLGLSSELKAKIEELMSLFTQNKRDSREADAFIATESITFEGAYKLIEEIKSRQTNKLLETASKLSCRSRRSSSRSS